MFLVTGLCLPVAAIAHPGHAGDGFGAGFMHPFLGLDHLLAMVVVGIWSVLHSRRVWLAPLCFVSFLAVGAMLGHGGLVVPQLEPLVAASVLVLGLMLTSPLGRSTSALSRPATAWRTVANWGLRAACWPESFSVRSFCTALECCSLTMYCSNARPGHIVSVRRWRWWAAFCWSTPCSDGRT